MADKTQLEEALEFLINEESDKAVASFHNFIVEKARSIHESLMEDDELDEEVDSDEVTESDDEEVTEAKDEEVTESDDEEVTEAKDDEEVTEAKDEEVTESDDEEKVEEGMNEYFNSGDFREEEDEVSMDMDMDADAGLGDELGGEEVAEETVEVSLDDTMEDLTNKFNALMDGGDEMDMGDDEMAEDRFAVATNPFAEGEESDEEAVEEAVSHGDGVQSSNGGAGTAEKGTGDHSRHSSISHTGDGMSTDNAKLSEGGEEIYDLTEEDFLDLEESLKAVNVTMGGEQGHGKFAGEETNTKSPVAQKSKSDVNADPKTMISKQDEHGTYKLEAAPSNDSLPHSNENNHDKAEGTPGRSTVAGHGVENNSDQGGEQGGKKFAGTETNTKSPLGSAGSVSRK